MENKLYAEGMSISRNFEHREEHETERLYSIIKRAVLLAIRGTEEENKRATIFLTNLFEPYIKKISSRIFHALGRSIEYSDVLQETYTMFLWLLKRYNPDISAFSYYIGVMLPQHMNRWAEKEMIFSNINISVDIKDHSVIDPLYSTSSSVESYLNAYVLAGDYKEFILKRAERQSRSGTVKEVCIKYFLGESTCSDIAKDLGISYHAVYEIIGKIKKELEEFFSRNRFSEYYISSTGIESKKCQRSDTSQSL